VTDENQTSLDLENRLEEIVLADRKVHKLVLLKDVLLKIVIPAVLVFIVVNIVFQGRAGKTHLDIIEKASACGNYKVACDQYEQLISKDFLNLDYHRGYINNYSNMAGTDGQGREVWDSQVKIKYAKYTNDEDQRISDVGYYGLGYYAIRRNQCQDALEYYKKIKNKQQKYVNNSIGYAYLWLGNSEKAKEYFYREIQVDGNLEGAYRNLATVFFYQMDLGELSKLVYDDSVKEYLPWQIVRYIHLKQFNLFKYISASIRFDYVTTCGFVAAVLVMIAWLQYLRKIDVFEPEKLCYLLITLALGMVFSELCTFLYDFWYFALDIKLQYNVVGDLIYCIFGIGLIEETVKIIPFLIMLKFSKQVNESIDYVIYACVSALGFAFMENLIYFQDPGLKSIAGRTLTAVLLHMSLSTFAMYGLYYSKYKKQSCNRIPYFLISFFVAILIHGLYDFFLISGAMPSVYKILSFVILALSVNRFSLIIKNALNISEFNTDRRVRVEYLSKYLVYVLSAIILFQYILVAYKFGPANANLSIGATTIILYILMFIIIKNLGTIVITGPPCFDKIAS